MSKRYTSRYEIWLELKNGREVLLRPISPEDIALIIDLFNRISSQSRYLRFLRHFRELPEDMLHKLTLINYASTFALVGVIKEDGKDTIIAVGRYSYDSVEGIADLAVTVRDDWQHLGLGKNLLSRIIDIGKEHGISRFGSMMDPQNDTMKKLLRDLGYQVRYFIKDASYQVEISA